MILINPWTFLIIIANVMSLLSSLLRLNLQNNDSEKNGRIMGISVIALWLSTLKYLTYSEKFSFLPNTLLGSASQVFNGLVGIIPTAIGWSFFMTTVLYESFRFMDCFSAMFTMFYVIQGDTVFDVYYGI